MTRHRHLYRGRCHNSTIITLIRDFGDFYNYVIQSELIISWDLIGITHYKAGIRFFCT